MKILNRIFGGQLTGSIRKDLTNSYRSRYQSNKTINPVLVEQVSQSNNSSDLVMFESSDVTVSGGAGSIIETQNVPTLRLITLEVLSKRHVGSSSPSSYGADLKINNVTISNSLGATSTSDSEYSVLDVTGILSEITITGALTVEYYKKSTSNSSDVHLRYRGYKL